jgi:hypothetical protein
MEQICLFLDRHHVSLSFGRETLSASDFGRYIHGDSLANDEAMNIFIAALNYPILHRQSAPETHMGNHLGLNTPPRDFHIVTTFFYPKLTEAIASAENDCVSRIHRLLKWFKHVRWFFISVILVLNPFSRLGWTISHGYLFRSINQNETTGFLLPSTSNTSASSFGIAGAQTSDPLI